MPMDELKKRRIHTAAEQLMAAHDDLLDILPKKKKLSEEDALLTDALDSLVEAITCLEELTEESYE